jgi:hypothetical protein
MSLNPEFTRNLWLQLSPQRLIAAPLVIGLLFALAHLGDVQRDEIADIAAWTFYLLVAFWGSRRAADSVAEEVAGGTWDAQRMSALGAWAMSWGKLLGGTIFVWYCAGLVLVAWVFGAWPDTRGDLLAYRLALFVGTGLLAQAVAMACCLAILGRGAQGRRLPVTLSQLVGLFVVLAGPLRGFLEGFNGERTGPTGWYGLPAYTEAFALLSLAAFLGWALVAIYRLMRVELQYRSYPFVWLAFLAFLILYIQGFLHDGLNQPDTPAAAWLLAPAAIAAALTYVVLFLQPKDIMRYRWLTAAVATGQGRRALALMPLWLPTFVVAAILVVGFAVLDSDGWTPLPPVLRDLTGLPLFMSLDNITEGRAPAVLAALFFMVRDIAIVLFLNFNSRSKRADLAAFIYLVVLYAVLPAIFGLIEAGALLPLFMPAPWAHPLVAILPPAIEAAIMIGLLAWRLAAARPMRMAVAAR